MSPQPATTSRAPFLLEIGSEEIPARFIPDAMQELAARAEALLREERLAWDGLRVLATPRRLALLVDQLDLRQPDRDCEIKGPPVSVAFDADGRPTAAAEGFARKAGVDLAACTRGSDQRGEFLLARKVEAGRSAAAVLAERLPGLILSIPFRKVMRWGDGDLEYPRPLQWLVALLGDEVVPARLGDLTADRLTRGHRTLSGDRTLELASAKAYLDALASAQVVVDPAARRRLITDGLQDLLAAEGDDAELVADEELLEEIVFLCEHPTPFLGRFGADFSVLPDRVITTALKSHQRYFSVSGGSRRGLLPCFAAVRDGGRDHLDNVVAGNERVLKARLADALFYWTFDQKRSPEQQVAQLSAVTWLDGYGTILDKTRRLQDLVPWLWRHGLGDAPEVPADLQRAALLCKSDLVSEMIKDGKEFTKLEGFIGARYAEQAGESEATCRAMERHYLPRTAGGDLPGDAGSSVLAVADRLDTVAGCWQAGFVPTGAKDPYALRRHVLAIIRILLDREARVDLEAAFAQALAGLAGFAARLGPAELATELAEFVSTRLAGYLIDNLGCDPAVVRAVVPVRWRDPLDALRWSEALAQYRAEPDFQLLATGFKRCRNILKGEILAVGELDDCLRRWIDGGRGRDDESFAAFTESAEIALRDSVSASAAGLAAAETDGLYGDVFATLSGLGPAIDRYFDSVRVNVEDPDLQRLRHAFLREIHGLFARYADFREVVAGDGVES